MAMLINGAVCDTFAHIDRRITGETVALKLLGRDSHEALTPEELADLIERIELALNPEDGILYMLKSEELGVGNAIILDPNTGMIELAMDASIRAYLFADGQPLPIDTRLTAECCITEVRRDPEASKVTVECTIGSHGEVIVPIPAALCIAGKTLYCEINISGTDKRGDHFRYKASSFRVSVIE